MACGHSVPARRVASTHSHLLKGNASEPSFEWVGTDLEQVFLARPGCRREARMSSEKKDEMKSVGRRGFLRGASALGAGAAIGSALLPGCDDSD